MNLLDLVILIAAVVAAVGGYRLGFLARSLSWIGLTIAILLAIRFVPDLMTALAQSSPRGRFFAVVAFVVGLGLLGQALGLALGTLLHHRLPAGPAVQRADRLAGAALGGVGVMVFVWLLVPALANAPGWPARQARDSAIVATIQQMAPEPPPSLRELGRMVAEAPYPQVFGPDEGPAPVGSPPALTLPAAVDASVRASVVRVEGRACQQIQEGSGFVVADDLVVTNAHVVAGERQTTVITEADDALGASVVAFDPRRDLAILRVPGLDSRPLELGRGSVGLTGAVYGHPGGGALRAAPARIAEQIEARGTDIYRTTATQRDVYVLAAALAPGDSGAPLVDERGRVVGIAFAIDPGASTTAYALTDDELRPLLDAVPAQRADTGSCLVG